MTILEFCSRAAANLRADANLLIRFLIASYGIFVV